MNCKIELRINRIKKYHPKKQPLHCPYKVVIYPRFARRNLSSLRSDVICLVSLGVIYPRCARM